MKKISSVFGLLLFALSISFVSAQSTYQIYVSDIQTNNSEYQVGDTVEGMFKISNLAELPQSDIYYTISSGLYSSVNLSLLNVQGTTAKTGPLYLKSRGQEQVTFSYILPENLTGSVGIKISAMLKDGTPVGQATQQINVTGEAQSELVSILDTYLSVSGIDEQINPQTGPTIYDDETIDFTYSLTSIESAITLTPTLKLYDRVDTAGTEIKTITLDSITVDEEGATDTIALPTDLKPLVYYGVLSFADSDDKELFSTSFRYIIAGPIATVRNIVTDKLSVNKGDSFTTTVTYGGQPIDEYRPEKQIQSATTTITVEAKNQEGEIVASVTQALDLKNPSMTIAVPMKAEVLANTLSFSSIIKTVDGKILDEYTTTLPSEESLKEQSLIQTKDSNSFVAVVTILIILALCILILFLSKKYGKFKISPLVFVFIFLFVSASVVFGVQKARAGLASGAEEYLRETNTWSNDFVNAIMGWFVIQSDNNATHFSVTSVSSPYPPAIKMYAPGEAFTLEFNATFGECNNESFSYQTFAYGWGWQSKVPKLNGTISERLAYWTNNGVQISNLNKNSSLKDLYLVSNVKGIWDIYNEQNRMTENRENALKAIVAVSDVNRTTTYGASGRLFRFAEDGETTIADYNTWARDYKDRASTAQTALNWIGALNDRPETKDFNFNATANLKNPADTFTNNYISKLNILNEKVFDVTKPSIEAVSEWYGKGKHTTELVPLTNIKTFNAPETPGYHRVFFYLYQTGNSGQKDMTVAQTICVKGAGLCPGEVYAPTVPVITGPTSAFKNTWPKFTFRSTDRNRDKIRYEIDWDNDGTIDQRLPANPYWWSFVDSGTTLNAWRTWNTAGTYWFKVRAYDNSNQVSDWVWRSIDIVDQAPIAPVVGGPTTGTVLTNYDFWFYSTDADNDALGYGVDTNNDWIIDQWIPGEAEGWRVPSGTWRSVATYWTTPGTYKIRVLAGNEFYDNKFNKIWYGSPWTEHSITISDPHGACKYEYINSCSSPVPPTGLTGEWNGSNYYNVWTCPGTSGGRDARCVAPAPPAPKNYKFTCSADSTKATLTWENQPGYDTIYFRMRDSANQNDTSYDNNYVKGNSYTVNITQGKTYYWWIHTHNVLGTNGNYKGAFSDAVGGSFTCSAAPTSSCTVSNVKSRSATINWTYSDANGDPQTGYYGIFSKNIARLDDANVASRYGTPDWKYPSLDANVPNTRSATVWDLQPGTTYYPASAVFNTPDQWAAGWQQCPAFTTLASIPPPTEVTATCDIPNKKINFIWKNASGYDKIYFRARDMTLYPEWDIRTLWNDTIQGVSSYSINNIELGHKYAWWIHTRTDNGDYSAAVGDEITCAEQQAITLTLHKNDGNVVNETKTTMSFLPNEKKRLPSKPFSREEYSFTKWTTEPNGTGDSYLDNELYQIGSVNDDLYAQWTPANTLTVTIDGTGEGNVDSDPSGINCIRSENGTDSCSENYTNGNVILTGFAFPNSTFTSWGGVCDQTPTTSPCIVNMSTDRNVTATFMYNGGTGIGPTGSFYFNPTTAGVGGTCPAYLNGVTDAASCTLVNTRSGGVLPMVISSTPAGSAPIGTWKLVCTNSLGQGAYTLGSPRSCFSNPTIIEN